VLQCSATCDDGIQMRRVVCQDDVGADSAKCEHSDKPPDNQTCNMGPCPRWNHGDWAQVRIFRALLYIYFIVVKLFRAGSATVVNECQMFFSCSFFANCRSAWYPYAKFLRKFMANENSICRMFIEKAELNLIKLLSYYNAISVEELKTVNVNTFVYSLCKSCSRCCVALVSALIFFFVLIFLCCYSTK